MFCSTTLGGGDGSDGVGMKGELLLNGDETEEGKKKSLVGKLLFCRKSCVGCCFVDIIDGMNVNSYICCGVLKECVQC